MGQTKILPKNEVLRVTGISGKQYKSVPWHSAQIIIKPLLTMPEYVDTVHRQAQISAIIQTVHMYAKE